MSNSRKLMPPLKKHPPSEQPKLMTAFMTSGELPENIDPTLWDRVTARIGISKSLLVAGQPKAGRSWL
jgi:hypothetical protein